MSRNLMLGSVMAAAGLSLLLYYNFQSSRPAFAEGDGVDFLCPPGHFETVNTLRLEFEKETGHRIRLEKAGDLVRLAGFGPERRLEAVMESEGVKPDGAKTEGVRFEVGLRSPSTSPLVLRIRPDAPASAFAFARYLTARDRGLPAFAAAGIDTVAGDAWEKEPEVHLASGAMLRPALEDLLNRFEKREGVRITRVYNGCGILVSQMRAGDRPDAYFACDVSFMTSVSDLFMPSRDVSSNRLVLAVPKGNPLGIKTMDDLLRPGLRVGLGHPANSALGSLTRKMMEQNGLQGPFERTGNLKLESATGDFLVNQIRTGSLDAVVVYVSNLSEVRSHLDFVPIDLPGANAVQPFAVGRASKHRLLMERLFEAIAASSSRDHFRSLGFEWKAPEAPASALTGSSGPASSPL